MKMATQFINQLTQEFDIARYKGSYSAGLMKLIKQKAKGKKTAKSPLRIVHSRSRDLMTQLKASLNTPKRKVS